MSKGKDLDLVSRLSKKERILKEQSLKNICPDDTKYKKATKDLVGYLSAEAEWFTCALIQRVLLETRKEFGQAEQKHLDEFDKAWSKLSALNMSLIEGEIKHDQLAVIEEIGRFVSEETKALLHPGTTSYDILDTARSYLFKNAWGGVLRPEVSISIEKLCELAERSADILQVGRTHLQNTSPVPLGLTFSVYAARLAERVEKCDSYFEDLRGKISGIVGTGASIEIVIGENKSIGFEEAVLKKLGLKPDYTATQIVQKERLADVGHGLTTLMYVLRDFANDIRMLYSSAIQEVTSRDNKERLGGSSADATKNNPINYENIVGKSTVVESGMRILYEMIHSDFQRDLCGSVMARYQPQLMMVETYEAFSRLNKNCLPQLSINDDIMAKNLIPVRENPSEAMVAILKGEKWVHSKYGVGHDFVKEMGKISQRGGRALIKVCLGGSEFYGLYNRLSKNKRVILNGGLEKYIGSASSRIKKNISYALSVIKN